MHAELLERQKDATVTAKLLFVERGQSRPAIQMGDAPPTGEASAIYTPRAVTLRDARAIAPALDAEGFALARHASAVRDFADDDEAGALGRAEAALIVKKATRAARVHVFDHTVRKRAPDAARQPSVRVHNDYTARSARKRVRELMGDEAESLLGGRVAFINVWRPIRHPAADWPLALADARSIDRADLIETDLIYPDRQGEIYGLAYNPAQRWFYAPDMQLDEALLIKCYDSRADVAQFTPHTAFENPLTPPGAPPRESIEFRAIAFFD